MWHVQDRQSANHPEPILYTRTFKEAKQAVLCLNKPHRYVCARCNHQAIDSPTFLTRRTEPREALTGAPQSHSPDITYGLCGLCAQAVDRLKPSGSTERGIPA
jgi:hypothetical protein